jgi:UDP-2-acetamido-2-deoxy-ribo-hexuluronate aminotransferase
MEFIDLKAQQKRIRSSLDERINKVLNDGRYILGEEVSKLENELSKFCGSKYTIGCSNGTDALMLSLMALDIGPGDGVITVPFTYIATLESIAAVGAKPILVDVYDSTFNMDPSKLEYVIKNSDCNIKAIMPVDLFGLPARHRQINDIASKYDLKVIDDAAQAFGASKGNNKIGTFSDITTTSFFPAKPLGCYGDGGAIFTDCELLNEKIRSLAVHGKGSDKYDNIRIGMNSRLDTLQAAVLLEKLSIFKEEIEKRNHIANLYRDNLKNTTVRVQHIPEKYVSTYAQFSIILKDKIQRDKIQNSLSNAGIPSVIYYAVSGHMQPGYSYLNYQKGDFPVSEKLSETILSIPMHPYLTEAQVTKITELIKINLN